MRHTASRVLRVLWLANGDVVTNDELHRRATFRFFTTESKRVALQVAIGDLRKEGYNIKTYRSVGYRLIEVPK